MSTEPGYVWVYSETGKGSTFKIYLPRVAEASEPRQETETGSSSLTGSQTILLVEDSQSLREMTCEYLESLGYKVLPAATGKEGLQKAAGFDGPIHLLLTDIVMPGMSGTELARELVPLRPETKVMLVSGFTDEVVAGDGIVGSSVVFLQKPYRPRELALKIRQVLGESVIKDQSKNNRCACRAVRSSVTPT